MNEIPNVDHSYSVEIIRKAIHLCSISIPVIYYAIPKSTALAILIPLTLAFVIADIARWIHPPSSDLFHRYFGWLLRARERDGWKKRLNGATYVLLSACFCIAFFPKVIAVTAFAILIISDTSAALVGRRYGKRPFLGKTLAGAIAFLASAIIVVAVSPKILYVPAEYLIGAAGAVVGVVVESTSINIDDNLSIPVAIGSTMWLLYYFLLPSVNVYALESLR
jgi:dolichol kinase